MFSTTHIEISRSALAANLKFIRSLIGPKVILSSVVKGNAYGHGIREMVPLLSESGVGHFSVFNAEEAWQVRQALDHPAQVMIMGMVEDEGLEWAIREGIEFFVFNRQRLEKALEFAKKLEKPARIHLEMETGMNRTGLKGKELSAVAALIRKNAAHFQVKGLCTHFAGAESIGNLLRVREQADLFHAQHKTLLEAGIDPERLHTCCSAAAIRLPEMHLDMVRCGILTYGLWPSREIQVESMLKDEVLEDPLQRVISWKSQVMSIKSVQNGEYIGYGTSYLAHDNMRLAVVPIGYGHGYTRGLSNTGRALIRGQRVGVIGLVNMNAMMVDVSELPEVEIGDEVVLIGKQDGLSISVASFGELSEQMNYELLTRLPLNIPRKVVD